MSNLGGNRKTMGENSPVKVDCFMVAVHFSGFTASFSALDGRIFSALVVVVVGNLVIVMTFFTIDHPAPFF